MDKVLFKFFNRQAKNVEKKLKCFENIKIVFDKDVDGLMSFLIVCSVLKKMKKKIKYYPLKVYELESFLSKQSNQNTLYIFLDLSLDKKIAEIIRKQKLKNIWIDHHQLKLFSSKDVFLINPVLVSPNSYIPTSAISYIIFDRLCHIEESLLFASIGIVADKGERECKSIIEKTTKKFNLTISGLRDIAERVNSIFVLNLKIEKILPKMFRKKYLLRGHYLKRIQRKAEKIVKRELSNALKKHDRISNIVLYKIRNRKYNLRSTIANILSEMEEFKDNVLVIFEERGEEILISLRNGKNSNVNLIKLLRDLNVSFKSFGGHKSASGAIILKKDFKEFLKKLKEYGRSK